RKGPTCVCHVIAMTRLYTNGTGGHPMLRFGRTVLLILAMALAAASPALAAAYTYNAGDNVSLRVGVGTAYSIYWFSDRDGFLMRGNPLTTTRLTTGVHKITYLIYVNASGQLVYRGSVDVEVKAAATTGSSTSTST